MKMIRISAALFLAAILTFALGMSQVVAAHETETVTLSGPSNISAAPAPYSFTVAAGQTYSGVIRGYCINFGKTFPDGSLDIKVGSDAKLGAALAYALDKGYADNNSDQTVLALWYLSDNTWHDSAISATDHTIAQEIATNAATYTPATSSDTSLLDATSNNQVQARITDFHPLDNQPASSHYYGEGTLIVTNTGSSPLVLYVPFGTIAPAASAAMQDMLLYASGPQQAAVTATAAPTTAPATDTPQPQPSDTPVPLVVEPTATTAPSVSTSPASSTLPTTGSGPNIILGLGLIFLSLMLVTAGYLVRKRSLA